MLGRYNRPIISICLHLGALFAILACGLVNSVGGGNSLAPVRNLTLTIDKSQRDQLFDQLQKFANKHAFETQLTDFNTKGENFQFWMSREDVTIIADNVPPDPTLVYISFFLKTSRTPENEKIIDDLLKNLEDYIYEIPNVIIAEEK